MGLNDRGGQNGAYSASNKPSRLHNQIVANEAAKAKQINTGERNATQKKVKNEDKFSNQILDNDQLTDRKHKRIFNKNYSHLMTVLVDTNLRRLLKMR